MSLSQAYFFKGGAWLLKGIAFVGGIFVVRYFNEIYDRHLSMDKKQLPEGNGQEI